MFIVSYNIICTQTQRHTLSSFTLTCTRTGVADFVQLTGRKKALLWTEVLRPFFFVYIISHQSITSELYLKKYFHSTFFSFYTAILQWYAIPCHKFKILKKCIAEIDNIWKSAKNRGGGVFLLAPETADWRGLYTDYVCGGGKSRA